MPNIFIAVGILLFQDPFVRTFGGAAHDGAYSVIQTRDEGFAVAGMTMSFGAGHKDILIFKLNSSGDLVWTRTLGGPGDDYVYSVIQTSDGGFATAGATTIFGAGSYDALVLRMDSLGNTLWAKTVGGTNPDYTHSLVQTGDGGFVLAGGTASFGAGDANFFLVKLDSLGNLVWARTFGDTTGDYAESLIRTRDGGFALAGWTCRSDSSKYNFLVIRTDSAGNLLWAKTFKETDYARSIVQTADGGFAVAGTINHASGNCDAFVLRLDSRGNLVWARTIGGTNNDEAFSVIQAQDGSFVVTGDTESFGSGNWDCLIFKMDPAGNLLWARTFGGKDTDWAYSLARTMDDGLVVGGWTKSYGAGKDDFLVLRLDENGNCHDCVRECSPVLMAPEPSISSLELKSFSCSPSVSEPELSITGPELTAKDACAR